jgi:pyruvate/2-oxoglutarate dehydrogenase complex dihydrolipoamide dehydrogenase (E3) component
LDLDVIIVGTGQAGVPLATRLAAAGKRVLIVERGLPGGTCVNVGCTPTKTLVASARAAHVARTSGRLGVNVAGVAIDFAAVMARKDALVARWRAGIERRLGAGGETLKFVRGHARFVAPRILEVNGERHTAPHVVLNVGARAALPELPGLADVAPLVSSTALALTELPKRLLILGAGPVACELGQVFRRLGADVTIIGRSARLLAREDEVVSDALMDVFRAEGIGLELGRQVASVARAGSDVEVRLAPSDGGASSLRGSHLLVATGRTPNTADLGCEAGNVAVDPGGHVLVDERYETSAPGVFAVGDCVPGPQFTHVSWDDHRVLFEILSGRAARKRTERLVPTTIFTDPQVAGVGLSEQEARRRGFDIEVAVMPFGTIARAIETDETAGVIKIVLDARTERVLGASIVGVDAGELIHVLSVLMNAGGSARAIVDGELAHPTFAEGLQTALMKLPRYALS